MLLIPKDVGLNFNDVTERAQGSLGIVCHFMPHLFEVTGFVFDADVGAGSVGGV